MTPKHVHAYDASAQLGDHTDASDSFRAHEHCRKQLLGAAHWLDSQLKLCPHTVSALSLRPKHASDPASPQRSRPTLWPSRPRVAPVPLPPLPAPARLERRPSFCPVLLPLSRALLRHLLCQPWAAAVLGPLAQQRALRRPVMQLSRSALRCRSRGDRRSCSETAALTPRHPV